MKKTKVIDQLNSLVWPGASLSYWVERYKTQVVIILPVVRDYLLSFLTVYMYSMFKQVDFTCIGH